MSSSISSSKQARTLLLTIVAAVILWGGYQALGVYLARHDLRQAAVVIGCFAVFLGSWFVLLTLRNRRVARSKQPSDENSEG